MTLRIQNSIKQNITVHLKEMFMLSLICSISVFLLLVLFQPFDYRSYPLFKVFSDSLLSAFLVLVITFSTRVVASYLRNGTFRKYKNSVVIYGITITIDMILFLVVSFLINLFSGGFDHQDYIGWFVLTMKYILIFEVLLIPLSLFMKRYLVLDSFFKNKNFSESYNSIVVAQSSKEKMSLASLEKEMFMRFPQHILMMKSSSNYIDIFYMKDGVICRSVVRKTLKNVSEALRDYPFLFRCHRSYLINIDKIEKVTGNTRGYEITIAGLSDTIPVSRARIALFDDIFYNK